MLTFPPAKINIGLRVVRRRADGYHDLQTIFYPIPLTDALEIVPDREEMIWDDGGFDPEGSWQDNLVYKAYELISREVRPLPPVEIILRKHIPTGAGLGGGSSDASAALNMLDRLYELGLSSDERRELARKLGADCPFFITPEPSYAEGIGDILSPIGLDLTGLHLWLALPPIHVSTALAYGKVTPRVPEADLCEAITLPLKEWNGTICNDFEEGVFAEYPLLGQIKETFYDMGADFALMSGSGSTIFALAKGPFGGDLLSGMEQVKILDYTL